MGAPLLSWWQRQVRQPVEAQGYIFRSLMTPLAKLYAVGAAYAGAQAATHSRRLPGTTISVGNLAVGGTGKSPVVITLASKLQALGYSPAILTRGYGSQLDRNEALALIGDELVMTTRAPVALPDETRMQAAALRTVPVIAGAQRYAAALRFMREQPHHQISHWLLDDGFQHRQLQRDVDLVLLDAAAPFGNGQILPRGILREAPAALRRATAVILTRWQDHWAVNEALVRRYYAGPLLHSRFVVGAPEGIPGQSLHQWQASDGAVLVLAGIADPQQFLTDVRKLRFAVADTYFVGDHESFETNIFRRKSASAKAVLTTAKDYWRQPAFFAAAHIPVFILPMAAQLDSDWLTAQISSCLF